MLFLGPPQRLLTSENVCELMRAAVAKVFCFHLVFLSPRLSTRSSREGLSLSRIRLMAGFILLVFSQLVPLPLATNLQMLPALLGERKQKEQAASYS